MADTSMQEAKKEMTAAERFTAKVMNEFRSSTSASVNLTDYQRTLANGYFIGIDRALKAAEEERLRKNGSNSDHKWDNNLPCTWANVNMNDLALDVVHYAQLGLDILSKNNIFAIPFKNSKTQKYDVNLVVGYNGIKLKAEKYSLHPIKNVTIELVRKNEKFVPHKKSMKYPQDMYDFEPSGNPFDRGEIVGGFGYIEYADETPNELIVMSLADILKRKPKYASAEFWGGVKKTKKGGTYVEEETDGWMEEMCRKTLIREVYSEKHILIDPKKIDDDYQYMKAREAKIAEIAAQDEIDRYANTNTIVIDDDTGEITSVPVTAPNSEENATTEPETSQNTVSDAADDLA